MGTDCGKVDCRLYAGIASAYHRHASACIERAVAVGAKCHAVAYVFAFSGDREFSPSCAGGDYDCFRLEGFMCAYKGLFPSAYIGVVDRAFQARR